MTCWNETEHWFTSCSINKSFFNDLWALQTLKPLMFHYKAVWDWFNCLVSTTCKQHLHVLLCLHFMSCKFTQTQGYTISPTSNDWVPCTFWAPSHVLLLLLNSNICLCVFPPIWILQRHHYQIDFKQLDPSFFLQISVHLKKAPPADHSRWISSVWCSSSSNPTRSPSWMASVVSWP